VPNANRNKSADTFCLSNVYPYRGSRMNSFQQIISAIYVALAVAAGGTAALRVANQVLRDAIADGAVDDPVAVRILKSLSHDGDDEDSGVERPSLAQFVKDRVA
jgi:hypothetical protein